MFKLIKPAIEFGANYKRVERLRDDTLQELLTGDEKIDQHINFHRNPAGVFGAMFSDFMYYASLEPGEVVDKGVLKEMELLSMYILVVFQNVDDIIDDLGLAANKRVDLIDEYLDIVKTGGEFSKKNYGYDRSKLEELAIMARGINSFFPKMKNKDHSLDNAIQLSQVAKEQITGSSPTRKYISPLVESSMEEVLEYISKKGFPDEDLKNLQIAARLGAFTLGCAAIHPYSFTDFDDPDLLRATYYWGASGQILDDMVDYKKDLRTGQVTFLTANPSIKPQAEQLRKDLLKKSYALLKPHQEGYVKFLNFIASTVTYLNSTGITNKVFPQKDHHVLEN